MDGTRPLCGFSFYVVGLSACFFPDAEKQMRCNDEAEQEAWLCSLLCVCGRRLLCEALAAPALL